MNVDEHSAGAARFEALLTEQVLGVAWRYACRLCKTHEDAEDLLQEALSHALVRIGQLREPERFKSWLMSIVRTRFLMQYRRKGLERERVSLRDDDPGAGLVDYRAAPGSDELAALVADALKHMPEDQREILNLFYLDGLSLVETAEVLGVSSGAVQQRLFRARGALRRVLTRQLPGFNGHAFEGHVFEVMQ